MRLSLPGLLRFFSITRASWIHAGGSLEALLDGRQSCGRLTPRSFPQVTVGEESNKAVTIGGEFPVLVLWV
ncbi:hypothetical protein [Candidatus Methylacidithermus pantelleriae]|uniref:hypothetical protein n=1 Tax=Candidatus Methylacidithermus pantelleriae TaxID=2744239 RepID=UPI00157BC385|nr:hypothetical protein [Candidatus Methylacidithermus pantelleriae]